MTLTHPLLARTEAVLGDLIARPSVSSDSNLDIIVYLAEELSALGAEIALSHDETGKKANLFATLGPDIDGGVVLSGHTDVVPVADQAWSSDPFQMRVDGDRLYGRGACDMKGFIACAIAAAPLFAAADLKRPVHFAFTYDEETGCLGAKVLLAALKKSGRKPAVTIIGEPTLMKIIEGHKGCCEVTTRFAGLEGHGSLPAQGVNAVEYAVRYVGELLAIAEDLKARAPEASRFDPPWTTINLGGIRGGVAHNVIANHCEVDWEFRPVTRADKTFVTERIDRFAAETLVPEMQAVWPEAGIEAEWIGDVDGLEPMDDSEAVALAHALTGGNAVDVVSFGTEAGLFQELGIDTVVCGPGSIEQAHKPDEFVARDQLVECLSMLERLIEKLT